MKKHGVGIVGFGWVAGAHLTTFSELPAFEPVAIMSRRKLDAAQIKAQYGADVRIYNDYEKFLADKDIEIVDICTPHPYHADQAVKAADAKKNLIIEKPMALTLEDARRMVKAVKKNGVKTSMCFECRFIGVAKATKYIIDQGLLGELYYAECDYYHGIGPWYGQFPWNVKKDMGGSSLLTAGIHALDMLLYQAKEEVEEVFSYATKNPHEAYAPYEYPTTTVTMLKFKSGRIVGKCASLIDAMQPYVFSMNFVGSHGAIKNDLFYSKKIPGLRNWAKLDMQLVDSGDVAHHPYKEQFGDFAECLDAGRETSTHIENAFETHRVAFAADKSAATGKPVRLSEFTL
ncbi:MAG: Gfo/Idh/MocA family oxidoreductase [Spirochaetia bacterium]|jgi:predicted dehydrogenase